MIPLPYCKTGYKPGFPRTRGGDPPITLADYSITPGYSAVPASKLKELKGIVCERNALIFRKKELGSLDWSNPSTLKTTVFKHIDLYAGISDRRKICALV